VNEKNLLISHFSFFGEQHFDESGIRNFMQSQQRETDEKETGE
jgi:hypothetical protein